MVHYDNDNLKPLMKGERVIVSDDGLGCAGEVENIFIDSSDQIWYNVSFESPLQSELVEDDAAGLGQSEKGDPSLRVSISKI